MVAARNPKPRETDLYPPIRDYLLAQGYTVRSEVRGCDITANKGGELIVIELKRGFSAALLIQATQRQRLTDSVYVALPRPSGQRQLARWPDIQHLLRRLELGLILVSFGAEGAAIEVAFHPLPSERRRNKRERRAILTELAARSGEYNEGGSSRRQLVTAYREAALFIAYRLDRHGPQSPRQLRALGCGPKTQSILARNVYGWFERVSRNLYRLKLEGQAALANYPHLSERFASRLAEEQPLTPSTNC